MPEAAGRQKGHRRGAGLHRQVEPRPAGRRRKVDDPRLPGGRDQRGAHLARLLGLRQLLDVLHVIGDPRIGGSLLGRGQLRRVLFRRVLRLRPTRIRLLRRIGLRGVGLLRRQRGLGGGDKGTTTGATGDTSRGRASSRRRIASSSSTEAGAGSAAGRANQRVWQAVHWTWRPSGGTR